MKSKITRAPKFSPVSIELTFETLEELREFELRMALYRKNLLRAVSEQGSLASDVKYAKGHNAPEGIGPLRRQVHDLLGTDSDLAPGWLRDRSEDLKWPRY